LQTLYPGLLSVLHGASQADTLFSVVLFLCFNTGDCVGKTLPKYFRFLQRPDRPRRLLVALVVEISFFLPLIIACAVVDQLHFETLAYVLAFCFAMTHGFVTISAYAMAGSIVASNIVEGGSLDPNKFANAKAHAMSKAGQLNFTCSFAGVFAGSMVAVGLSYSDLVSDS
jgi:hypothetical protein